MSNSSAHVTYMMFTKRGKGVSTLVGPFFRQQSDAVRKAYFQNRKRVHMIEETAFASLYPQRYNKHVQKFWIDKVHCYLAINAPWIGQTKTWAKEEYFVGEWFELYLDIDEDSNDDCFKIFFSVKANPFYVARLKQDLLDLKLFSLKEGDVFYEDNEGRLFTKNNAISRSLADDLIKGMCLT